MKKNEDGKVLGFFYKNHLSYSRAEDIYKRRYREYSYLEENLKKTTTYTIHGVNLSLKEIESRLHGNKRTLE